MDLLDGDSLSRNVMFGTDDDKDGDMRDELIGTWKLVAAVNEDAATGEKTDLFGPDPIGYLTYGADGRMMAIQVRSDRKKPAATVPTAAEAEALFKSLLSYAGAYTIDGNEVTHHVDISWNENWTGTQLTRKFRLEGNRLYLSVPPSPNPIDGRMGVRSVVWEKLE